MIITTKSIQNNEVHVVWLSNPETVLVINQRQSNQQPFCGFEGLQEMYESFYDSFSEQTDWDTTIAFFKPNIQQTKF